MKHTEILLKAAQTVRSRDSLYGEPLDTLNRTAALASLMLRIPVQPYHVAMILHAMKLARASGDLRNQDHYLDGINYLAFAGEIAASTADQAQPAEQAEQAARDFDPENFPAVVRGVRPAAPAPATTRDPVAGKIG